MCTAGLMTLMMTGQVVSADEVAQSNQQASGAAALTVQTEAEASEFQKEAQPLAQEVPEVETSFQSSESLETFQKEEFSPSNVEAEPKQPPVQSEIEEDSLPASSTVTVATSAPQSDPSSTSQELANQEAKLSASSQTNTGQAIYRLYNPNSSEIIIRLVLLKIMFWLIWVGKRRELVGMLR